MIFQKLILYTSNLTDQKRFYIDALGFELIDENNSSFTFRAGAGRICLKETTEKIPAYHFAFNIPENKIAEAENFISSVTNILRDEKSRNKIIDFKNWNAHSVYFFDKDNNIVEFIARHNLKNSSQSTFHVNQITELSEVGITVNSIEPTFKALKKALHIDIFYGNLDKFCAAGDERGLFILSPANRNWFPTDVKSQIAPFKLFVKNEDLEREVIYSPTGELNIN